jgi:hypothetical protein
VYGISSVHRAVEPVVVVATLASDFVAVPIRGYRDWVLFVVCSSETLRGHGGFTTCDAA